MDRFLIANLQKKFVEFLASESLIIKYPNFSKFVKKLMLHSFTSLFVERCLCRDRLAMTKKHASMLSIMKIKIYSNITLVETLFLE